jgi:hypothetical protein
LEQVARGGGWSTGNPADADPDCIVPGFLPDALPLFSLPGGVYPMTESNDQTLLEELDARQDEVMGQLDELNEHIEEVLEDWTGEAKDPAEPADDELQDEDA